jgi:hypothetical protein
VRARVRVSILCLEAAARMDAADEAAAAGDHEASKAMTEEAMELVMQARKLAERAMAQ